MKTSKEILTLILNDGTVRKKASEWRTSTDRYTIALLAAVDALPEGRERRAISYLARNPGAWIVLDAGDTAVTNGLKMAIERM